MNRNGDRPLVYDVVVVGGGPVGVAMAMACAHRGLSAVVLEKDTEVYDLPRAIVMDDEVQRALWLNGAGSGLAGVTSPLAGAEFVDTGGARIIGIDIPDGLLTPLGFPPVVRYYQPELEAFLRDRTIVAGARLSLGSEVTAIAQDDTSAWAMLRDGRRVEGRWLVAADGASSPIRKSLGIAFESQGFDQEWLVVDVRLRDGADPQLSTLVQQWCDPARPVTFVPGHDRYRRWEFQLQPGETREEMVAEERVWQLLGPWLTSADAVIVRAVVYRFHATVAERMRAGRVFLAGDAAHQTPPFLGQGLCAGVRDAANLSWKLQLVAAGSAGDVLLDTYDRERRPHAVGLVAHAVDTGRLIDQLAGRGGDTALDSAYGGQRPFPHLLDGFLAGEHPQRGRQIADLALTDGGRLDACTPAMATGMVVVTDDASAFEGASLDRWRAVGAAAVSSADLHRVGLAGAVVVRPDRNIASVSADADEFAAHTDHLLAMLAC